MSRIYFNSLSKEDIMDQFNVYKDIKARTNGDPALADH